MTENILIAEAYSKVAELAHALGVQNLSKLPGCWVHQVNALWTIKVNPHGETVDGIRPFEMYIEFTGWPAGIIHPTNGGVIAAGVKANEATFIAAVDAAIVRAIGDRRKARGETC